MRRSHLLSVTTLAVSFIAIGESATRRLDLVR